MKPIPQHHALQQILETVRSFGAETVPLEKAAGRVLAEAVYADRDLPPFDRATKDGIAVAFDGLDPSDPTLPIHGVIAAGSAQGRLKDGYGTEIMTGAVVPNGADTIVMYEHVEIANGVANIRKFPTKGQDIHPKGSDRKQGELLIQKGQLLGAADIGILAAVGKSQVLVAKHPNITVLSTGDEVIPVEEIPEPHQIRDSNSAMLLAALSEMGIRAKMTHCKDEPEVIRNTIQTAIDSSDVVLMSGGVSMGKYDYLPLVLEELGIQNRFHGVWQRPGKPFWFGQHPTNKTVIFSFPGNPVSTFVCFKAYFVPWLKSSLGLPLTQYSTLMTEAISAHETLVRFLRVTLKHVSGIVEAKLLNDNGSGDLASLAQTDAFVVVPVQTEVSPGDRLTYIPIRPLKA